MMKKSLLMGALGASLAAPAMLKATVISFHDASQGYPYYGDYNALMYGQGAAADPGNNVWNGFGGYGGPGSTYFYGGGHPDSVPSGNPGNPYAWYSGTSTTGATHSFVPANFSNGGGNANSDGSLSPVTLNLSYAFDNGVNVAGPQSDVVQGTPSWILSEAALVQGSDIGDITLGNVPAGTYDLFLYGANFDGNRGATFNVASGTPVGGYTETLNPGGGTMQTYILGEDYVEYTGVTPDSFGNIDATWAAVNNLGTGESGEGDFNGLQLVSVPAPVPEPASIALIGMAGIGLLARRRRRA